ncbi:hypothetical protein U5N54_02540 [Bacillus paralicheniformis]|uniref:hypothetical protein n=1 Tax=Bacillus TaxID=1386 RepID=UPI0006924598|nr:hypothetical protein [Bacillus sp. MSP5.4]
MNYKLSPRLERYFEKMKFEDLVVNSLFDETAKKVQRWMDSELKMAFDHFNLTLDEAEKRARVIEDEDGNQILLIDGIQALVIHKPTIAGSQANQHFTRLYEREAAE